MKSRTIPIVFVKSLLANAISNKMDISKTLEQAEIAPNLLANDRARISIATFARLCRLTYQFMDDEATGYYPQPQKIGTFSVLMRYAANANTLKESIERAIEFHNVLHNGITLSFHEIDTQQVAVRMTTDTELNYSPWVYESLLVSLHRLFCWLCETHLLLHHVKINYPEPSYSEEYHYLFSSPIYFDQPYSEIVLKKADLQLSINKNSKRLENYISRAPYDLLHLPRNDKSYAEKVRRCLKSSLPNIPEYESIAQILNIHPQTLRRRLKREGCDYRQIRNELIRDMALSHLRRGELEIKQIAYALGFSEPSAFIRSFKRWTGTTPNQYRKKNNESNI